MPTSVCFLPLGVYSAIRGHTKNIQKRRQVLSLRLQEKRPQLLAQGKRRRTGEYQKQRFAHKARPQFVADGPSFHRVFHLFSAGGHGQGKQSKWTIFPMAQASVQCTPGHPFWDIFRPEFSLSKTRNTQMDTPRHSTLTDERIRLFSYTYQPKFKFSTLNLKLILRFFHRNLFFNLYL